MRSKAAAGIISPFFQEIGEFNITELARVPLQSLSLKVSESDVHILRCTRVDRECESERIWTQVLTPTNLQPVVIEGRALEGSDLVEGHSGSWVDGGDEPSMLLLEGAKQSKIRENELRYAYPVLCNTSPDRIEQVLRGCLRVDVANVDHPVQWLVPIHVIHLPRSGVKDR